MDIYLSAVNITSKIETFTCYFEDRCGLLNPTATYWQIIVTSPGPAVASQSRRPKLQIENGTV